MLDAVVLCIVVQPIALQLLLVSTVKSHIFFQALRCTAPHSLPQNFALWLVGISSSFVAQSFC